MLPQCTTRTTIHRDAPMMPSTGGATATICIAMSRGHENRRENRGAVHPGCRDAVGNCRRQCMRKRSARSPAVAKDTSDAVLPGVTVEASSPALDRKGPDGRYRRHRAVSAIVNLPPGTYVVTFTLTRLRAGQPAKAWRCRSASRPTSTSRMRVGDGRRDGYGDAARRRSSICSRPRRPPSPTRGHSRSCRQADRG